MTRHLYLALQAYGDNVVSFRLLRELRGHADLAILGTDLTRQAATLVGFDAFPIEPVAGDVLAFYNVRDAGLLKAARDFGALCRALRARAGPDTAVLFENQRRPGTHKALQLLGGHFRYRQPRGRESAYEDRRRMLEAALGRDIVLPPCRPPRPPLRRILIAPAARQAFRSFPPPIVANLIDYAAAAGAEVCLVDPAGEYAGFRAAVATYLGRRPLAEGAGALRQSDLVFAADSLFLHLAYYLDMPVVAVVPERIARDFYFAPPGLLRQQLCLPFGLARDRQRLFLHLNGLAGRT